MLPQSVKELDRGKKVPGNTRRRNASARKVFQKHGHESGPKDSPRIGSHRVPP